jgi:hypothetical protein
VGVGEEEGKGMGEAMSESFNRFLSKVIMFLPNLLAMISIFIVGFLIAWLFKFLLLRLLRAVHFDNLCKRWGVTEMLWRGGLAYSPAQILSQFLYWVLVLVTLILGINALEVAATHNLIARFFNYLPHLFAAVLILGFGYLIAIFLSQATLIAAVNAKMESARLLSRIVRWFVIVLSLTMALYELGIAEKLIIAAFSITLGGIFLALAIAFGWGGKELARDFLERIYRKPREEERGGEEVKHV